MVVDDGEELVYEEDRRQLAVSIVTRELEIAGDERRRWSVSKDLAGWVRLARAMRIAVTEISAEAGLTRPTVYDMQGRPSEFGPDLLRVAILALLATVRYEDGNGIASTLGMPTAQVLHALALLAENGQVSAGAVGQLTADAPFKLMAKGETALREHAEFQLGHQIEGYTFYIEVAEQDKAAVERAASRLLKHVNVLGAHVAHSMRMPELAFIVKADSDREAFTIAREIWEQVAKKAKPELGPPHFSLVLPPRSQR